MKYTFSKENSEISVKFKTTATEWDNAVIKAYQETKGKYKVPGFRQGRAPKHVMESMYGVGVFADDAMDILIQEGYELFLKENEEIMPLDRPSVTIDKFDGKTLAFTIKFPVTPDVVLADYKGVEVEEAVYEVNDDQVEQELKRVLERSARNEEKDGPAEEGDTVNLDYSGSVDGVKFDGGTAEKYNLVLGSHTFIPGFEEQLIGVSKGEEKDVNVKFPEEYHADNLKGKDAVFACKINSVSKKVLPEMNDEWVKDVSEFDTLADYKNSIKERLVKQATSRARTENENNVINAIVEKSSADIPEVLIQSYLDDMLRDMEMRMYYQGMKLEDYFKYTGTTVDDFRKERHDEAKRGALTRLCLEEIIKRENIVATDEEAEAKYAESMPAPKEGEEIRKPDERELSYLKNEIVMNKLLNMLIENAKFVSKATE